MQEYEHVVQAHYLLQRPEALGLEPGRASRCPWAWVPDARKPLQQVLPLNVAVLYSQLEQVLEQPVHLG